jgi:hypothetical protein
LSQSRGTAVKNKQRRVLVHVRAERRMGWRSGFLHCATDDETVRRFGRNDGSLAGGVGAWKKTMGLPDADAVFGCEVEFVGGLDVEGGVPAVFVADGEGAVLAGGVGVGEDLLA